MEDEIEASYYSEFNNKIINDPIYGCIGLSKTEVQLLDTRAMQRLRRIRQMGFSSYIFPSGEHSRFVHSLGVLYIMGKMCDQLYREYGNSKEYKFTIDDARRLRIAALLHDVGHFPFSHLSENVYSFIEDVEVNNLTVDEPEGTIKHLISLIANYKKKKEKDHEHLSAEVIKNDPQICSILIKEGIEPAHIGEIITGDTQAKLIYAQLLHSSLDADRLDYLLRDSRQAGVVFGNVELEYILRQIRIHRYEANNEKGISESIDVIAFDCRGQHAIEHFLMGRYFHYNQVIHHKTAMAFEAIAKALIFKVLQKKTSAYSTYNSIAESIGSEDFYAFTDDSMWELIREVANTSEDGEIKLFWEILSERKKPKHVITRTDIIPKKSAQPKSKPVNDSSYFLTKWILEHEQDELASEVGVNSEFIGYVASEVRLESIPSHLRADECSLNNLPDEAREAIRLIDKAGNMSFLASDSKSLLNKMVDYTSNTLDIFVVGIEDENKIDDLRYAIEKKIQG